MSSFLGQLMMIGVSGTSLTEEEKKFIVSNNISGVTLFGRNCKEPNQIRELCKEIQSLRHQMPDRAPLFIGVDMEGGRVARLKAPFTQWPPLKKLGDLDSPAVSFHFAYNMGLELKAVGINLDYAPCVDVLTNPKNTVIGDRAVSTDAQIVAKHTSALIRGYIKSEVITCAKHFPGHGNTLIDSHEDLPIEESDMDRLKSIELVPFIKAFKSRVDMVMTSHILFPKIDPEWPVTLSNIFLNTLLRGECRYRGVVVTDDLGMKALAKHHPLEKIPVRALQAGADLLLYCNEPDAPPKAIEAIKQALIDKTLSQESVTQSYKRILELKKSRIPAPDPLDKEEAFRLIGHPDHFRIAQALIDGKVPSGLSID